MKRGLLLSTLTLVILLLCSCSNGSTVKAYTPPEDIEITYSGLLVYYNNRFKTVAHLVENNSDKVIKNISVEVAEFDKNGYFLESHSISYDSINLVSNENKILSLYGAKNENTVYLESAISALDFMDGSSWEAESIQSWLGELKNGIDIAQKKSEFQSMKAWADTAESNDYMSISVSYADHDNISTSLDFSAKIKDIGNNAIESFELIILCYDNNGYPIKLDEPNFALNSTHCEVNGNHGMSGGKGTGQFKILTQNQFASQVKSVLSKIEFANGEIWINRYAPYWELYHGDVFGK